MLQPDSVFAFGSLVMGCGLSTTPLAEASGADAKTFGGLSGIGDLITTCISPHGRNLWMGKEIGKGRKLNEILKETEMAIEGVPTAKSAFQLSRAYKGGWICLLQKRFTQSCLRIKTLGPQSGTSC